MLKFKLSIDRFKKK